MQKCALRLLEYFSSFVQGFLRLLRHFGSGEGEIGQIWQGLALHIFKFKILLMTFKAIHGMAPYYICKLIRRRKSTGYSLRSTSKNVMLEVPSAKILPTLGGRAFCYATPKLWNNLPSEISSLDSLLNFKCHVKTNLFKQAFNL